MQSWYLIYLKKFLFFLINKQMVDNCYILLTFVQTLVYDRTAFQEKRYIGNT